MLSNFKFIQGDQMETEETEMTTLTKKLMKMAHFVIIKWLQMSTSGHSVPKQ